MTYILLYLVCTKQWSLDNQRSPSTSPSVEVAVVRLHMQGYTLEEEYMDSHRVCVLIHQCHRRYCEQAFLLFNTSQN